MSSKSQKKHKIIASILVNTIQNSHTLKNNIYHSNKRGPPPFFHSDTNPLLGHVRIHSFDKTHVLVVTVELIWLLFLTILPFNFVPTLNKSLMLTRFRRSYVNRPAVVLTNHTRYPAFLLDVLCAVQIGHVPLFCSCLKPMMRQPVEDATCFVFFLCTLTWSRLNYVAIFICNKDLDFICLLYQFVVYSLPTVVSSRTGNRTMDLFYLLKKTLKYPIWLINLEWKLWELVSLIKLFFATKMKIPKNTVELIARHWIRLCLHRGIGGRLPIHFTVLKLMAPTKQ